MGTSFFDVEVGEHSREVDILNASHVRKVPIRVVLLADYTKKDKPASILLAQALGASPKILT